jgi:hypothetical protein
MLAMIHQDMVGLVLELLRNNAEETGHDFKALLFAFVHQYLPSVFRTQEAREDMGIDVGDWMSRLREIFPGPAHRLERGLKSEEILIVAVQVQFEGQLLKQVVDQGVAGVFHSILQSEIFIRCSKVEL